MEDQNPDFGKTDRSDANSGQSFGKINRIHENSIPRFGKTSQIHENLIPSHVLTTEIRRTQRLHTKFGDMKLIRCNKPSLRDLSADDVCRKLKNVTNLMEQKSRRDDTSVENTYSTSLNPVGMKYRYIREYCDDNLRITDMSSRRDDTLLTVCFSLRTDDVSKMCRQICRKICYTLLISHPLVRILSVFSFPLRLKYVSLL
jgi:hypothetical protein